MHQWAITALQDQCLTTGGNCNTDPVTVNGLTSSQINVLRTAAAHIVQQVDHALSLTHTLLLCSYNGLWRWCCHTATSTAATRHQLGQVYSDTAWSVQGDR